ncbi:coproporphyrinogen-III oxidase family protein [Paenibacillus mesotrionivorans]|uniref:Coproporphyrinogen-III oxidase family protein n=1 Tax=Paenibacillus mesotrionivorans TaxID=3160968 RepID=A0ACC7NUL1_9BACL
MSISDAILKLQKRDNELSVDQYNAEIERLVRNDQRVRVIPYWYPYYVYNYQTKSNNINELVKSAWLERRYESDTMAIYLHVPFCKQKCGFCQWYTIVKPEEEYEVYTNYIIKEIEMYSQVINMSGKKVKSIFFGGGTPNLLTIDQIGRIARTLHKHFDTSAVEEFSIEVFPDALTEEYVAGLRSLGFNRVSMGVQTFDTDALQNDYKRRAIDAKARYLDIISNIKKNNMILCIDMLADLPNQTFGRIRKDLDEIISISPEQIAYAYVEYRNALIKKDLDYIPTYTNRKACYFHTANRLTVDGYAQIDDMMFSKKHVPLFWVDLRSIASVEIAFGPHGRGYTFNGSAYMNGDYDFWKENLEKGQFPVFSIEKLNDEDLILKYLTTGTYYGRIDIDEFKSRFSCSPQDIFPNFFKACEQSGLIETRDYEKVHDYYNYMNKEKQKIDMIELTEMGKHYMEVMRLLLIDKKYKRRLKIEQLSDYSNSFYKEICKDIL